MTSLAAILAGVTLVGVLFNTAGAFVALLPDFPWVRSYRGLIPILGGAYNEYEDRREGIRTAQKKIREEKRLSSEQEGYNHIAKVVANITRKDTEEFSSIYYQEGHGIYPVMDEGDNPDAIPAFVLDTAITESLQLERQDIDRRFLIGGLALIGIGFLIQVPAIAGEIFASC